MCVKGWTMRVGLLEDDAAIQEMLLLVLQDEGYTVIPYADAEVCLVALSSVAKDEIIPVDLMIIDWRLAGSISGTQVIQQLRGLERLKTLPIILTTAANFSEIEDLPPLNVNLLQKPFAVDDMIELIKRMTSSPPSN